MLLFKTLERARAVEVLQKTRVPLGLVTRELTYGDYRFPKLLTCGRREMNI